MSPLSWKRRPQPQSCAER